MKIARQAALFAFGAIAYVGLEFLWRGRSHYSMFLAGGICFLLLGKLEKTALRLHWIWRALLGALTITSVELLAGLIFNRTYCVWDYRAQPLNFCGQICLFYSLLWLPVGMFGMWLYQKAEKLLQK